MRERFRGQIAGAGSSSGVRLVVGRWVESPYGAVTDVMVETAGGHRVLLAPTAALAEFVAATYSFDEVRVEPVVADVSSTTWSVSSRSLSLSLEVGGRTALGRLLALVPGRVAESPAWCAVTDPVARVLLRGVRTRGTAVEGRREWYGATSVRSVVSLRGSFDGHDLGVLAPVDPPCRFGFSSTPTRPSVTSLVTTVEVAPRV